MLCKSYWASLVSQMAKNPLIMQEEQETWVWSLGQEDTLEKGMAVHSSISWKIPCTEEPGGLLSMGSQRVRHDWETNTLTLSRLIEQNELNNILKITGIWRSLINNNSLPTLHLSHFQFRLSVALWWIVLLQGCSQRSPKTIFNQIKELIKAKRKCIHFSFQAPKGWSCFLFVWSRLNWPNAIEQRKFLILVLKLVLVLQNGLETINREQPLPNHELESSYTFIMKAPWITSSAHIFNFWLT